MFGKTLPILLAAAVAAAPTLCCCTVLGSRDTDGSACHSAVENDTRSCCPVEGAPGSRPDSSDGSSCACGHVLLTATDATGSEAITCDPVQLARPCVVLAAGFRSEAEPFHATPPDRLRSPSGRHGDSLHSLSCLFT